MDECVLRTYNEYFGKKDEWFAGMLRRKIGRASLVFLGEGLCPTEHLKCTEFYNHYPVKNNMEQESAWRPAGRAST